MPVDSSTRRYPTQSAPPPPSRGGFNPLTLGIAAIAAVVSAVVVSHFWSGGTLWATAMTPVIVALVKETLERPAQKITEVGFVPRRQHPDDLLVEEIEPDPRSARPQVEGYKSYGLRRKHYKLALLTGLVAFVIAAAILTIPELVAGRSLTNSHTGSTLFKGKSKAAKRQPTETQTVTTTTSAPEQQQTTPAPEQQQTTTTPPEQTTTTPPPSQTAPTPQDTTPAPPANTTPATPPQP